MSSPLEQARAEVARLEKLAQLEDELAQAGAAYEQNPSPEALKAHDDAAVALVEARSETRTEGGPSVGGDVTVTADGQTADPAPTTPGTGE